MKTIRVSLDFYMEDEFESDDEAKVQYLQMLQNDITENDLTVTVWNEETEEWE